MLSMGRWFLPVVSAISSFYDLPWVTGLMAILFHALGAVAIVGIFKVKKTVTACLIGAMVVSFPTVTSVMMYNYVADAYALSFLINGDESLADELMQGRFDELVEALGEAYSLISVQNFMMLSSLAKNVGRMIAKSK